MKRMIMFLLLIIIFLFIPKFYLLAYQKKWKVGVFDIKGFSKTSDILSNSFKKSLLTLLSIEFYTIDITNSTIDKQEVIRSSVNSSVNFSIFGFISEQHKNDFTLVLQLVDVANQEVKLTKEYSFEYNKDDTEKVFETIDNVTQDFKEGVLKTLPKYREELAVEYVKKIEEIKIKVDIPGTFFVSFLVNMYINPMLGIETVLLTPSIFVKYINTKNGGIFGNGWFIGGMISEFASIILTKSTNVHLFFLNFVGREISVFGGTEVLKFDRMNFGIGLDLLLIRGHLIRYSSTDSMNREIGLILRPIFHFNFNTFDIFIIPTYYSEQFGFTKLIYERDINGYLSLDTMVSIYLMPSLTLDLIAGLSRLSFYERLEVTDYRVSFGISKYFRF
ncbi:MAG: hypothetical protein ACK4F9_03165 [Brevinematia bacterium]